MNVRAEVIRAIFEDEGSAVGEQTVVNQVDTDPRKVKSALQALGKANILNEHGMVGTTYWSIDPGVSKQSLEQAISGRTPGEVAEDLMQASSLFGDINESGDASAFEDLL